MAWGKSKVTVPPFGRGHETAGAQLAAEFGYLGHHVGGGNQDIKVHHALLDFVNQLFRTRDVSPGIAGFGYLFPLAITATRMVCPVPLGKITVVRSCWSVYLGSIPNECGPQPIQ
jgi:hypothetical protein